ERSSLRVLAGATWSRAKTPGDAAPAGSSRWLYYIDEAFSVSRFRDGRRTTASLSLQSADGKLGRIRIQRFMATGTVSSTEIPFAFSAQHGLAATDASTERFTIGGNPPTMLPTGVLSQFIAQPALSPFFTGERLQ